MNQLGMFAKFWRPGKVKTRLAVDIGADAASRLYRNFLETLLCRLESAAARREVVYAPSDARSAFETLVQTTVSSRREPRLAWQLTPQCQGDLGERMRSYFDNAFDRGMRRVVLIGSDSPTLPLARIHEAFEQLSHHPVVLGPSEDGGYYLVGARQKAPPIFDSIDWSTPEVWPQTVARLRKHRLSYAELAPWYDVDGLDDLHRLRDELRRGPVDRLLHRLKTEVDSILAAQG